MGLRHLQVWILFYVIVIVTSDSQADDTSCRTPENCNFSLPGDQTFCGWTKLYLKQICPPEDNDEERGCYAELDTEKSRWFLQSTDICPQEGKIHCLAFDYRLPPNQGTGVGGEVRVSLDNLVTSETEFVWVSSASQTPGTGWETAKVPLQASQRFLVKIQAFRCGSLQTIAIDNIEYYEDPCSTEASTPTFLGKREPCHTAYLTSSTPSTLLTTSSVSDTPTTAEERSGTGGSASEDGDKDDDEKNGDEEDDDEEGVPVAVAVSVALGCGVVLTALLVLVVVRCRRSLRKHSTSAVDNEGYDCENTPGAGQSKASQPPQAARPAPHGVYSHLDAHRKAPPSAESRPGFPCEDDNYSHLASATGMTSRAAPGAQSEADDAYTEVEGVGFAPSEAGLYHVLEENPAAARPAHRRGDGGDYHHLTLGGGRREGVEEAGEEGGGRVYDGLQGEEGDTYSHVRRDGGRRGEVVDGLYSHI